MVVNSPDVTLPLAAGGARLRSLSAVLVATLLGVTLQWVIARVYGGLIVETFGGALARGVTAGPAIPLSYLLTAIATFACAAYGEKRSGVSRVLLVIHLVAVIIPLQALVAAQAEFARPEFAAGVTVAYVGTIVVAGVLPEVQLPRPSERLRALMVIAAVFLTLYVLASLLRSGGLARLSFDLSAVYEVREEYVERAGPLIGYLVPWQGYVLNPALMLIAVRRRSLLLGLVGLALQMALFGMTGYRAFLLNPVLLLIFYFVGWRRLLTSLALGGMLAVVGVALVAYAWLDEAAIPALLVDRVIVVPAEIHYWYYDFFGVHGQAPLQLSQSILAAVSSSYYRDPIAEVIGWAYTGHNESDNVGLFGDAFANFGFAGCAVYALLFALVLKILDAAGRGCDPRIAAGLLAMPAFQLVNSGLLTTLLTHGLALTALVLWALTPSAPLRARKAVS